MVILKMKMVEAVKTHRVFCWLKNWVTAILKKRNEMSTFLIIRV